MNNSVINESDDEVMYDSDVSNNQINNFQDSSDDNIDIFTNPMTPGYPLIWIKTLLKHAKIENNNVTLYDNQINGIELIGYVKQLKKELILSHAINLDLNNIDVDNKLEKNKKDIKKKKESKMEIDEDTNELDFNQQYVQLIILDDHVKKSIEKLVKENQIISFIGTISINNIKKNNINNIIITLNVNHYKIISLNDPQNKRAIKRWLNIKNVFMKQYLQSTQELPLPWWESSRQNNNYRNENTLTFQEWIDGNPLYSKYALFLSNLSITSWSDFKKQVVSGAAKYKSFVDTLHQEMNEQLTNKFINDTMTAISKYA